MLHEGLPTLLQLEDAKGGGRWHMLHQKILSLPPLQAHPTMEKGFPAPVEHKSSELADPLHSGAPRHLPTLPNRQSDTVHSSSPNQHTGCSILCQLKFLYHFQRQPHVHCVTIIKPGCDQGIITKACSWYTSLRW